MHAVTKLLIYLEVGEGQLIQDALKGLPDYSRESFQEHSPGKWHGDFVISCPVAPELADGDFADDFAPYFPVFLYFKQRYHAEFELQIAVGAPGPEQFEIPTHLVALIASLGASICVTTSWNAECVDPPSSSPSIPPAGA